jgi:hypothetical protein
MNERIKELYKQAGFTVARGWGLKDTVPEDVFIANVCVSNEMKKFAELIVKECLAHGKLTQSQAVVNGSEEYNAGREMGIEVFMNQIKRHFGVTE